MTSQKSRILYVKKFPETQTDETHLASMADILPFLDRQGLIESGVDVVCDRGRRNEYFIGERVLEMPELKLLVDAVQSSKIISARKSKALIGKLMTLASAHQGKDLNRQLYVDKHAKPRNDKVLITVDMLNKAIGSGKQIHFKHNRKVYIFSPYGLIWNDDRYYAVGHSESHGKVITFRVDRIAAPTLTDDPATPKPEDFDLSKYAQTIFKMLDGPVRNVTLKCRNDMMKYIIDRFDESVVTKVYGDDADHFYAHVNASVSMTFFDWVFGFGGKIEIVAPDEVVLEYIDKKSK